jgi:DNA-directed RNA polymerase specialized sigma24 family protein
VDSEKTDGNREPAVGWAALVAAYRASPGEPASSLLLEQLGPWLTAALRQLRAVPPYIDAEDIRQELAAEVLRIARRWRPGCEDRWVPRRLVEKAARQVSKSLIRERLSASEELDPEADISDDEPGFSPVFETPLGKATAADLRVIYRFKVLGEPVSRLAAEAGVSDTAMRRRIRRAFAHARAAGPAGVGE